MGKHPGNKELMAKLEAMLNRYRWHEDRDPDLDKVATRQTDALPYLFALAECWFIQAANNGTELIPHYGVMFCEISGQANGAAEHMILPNFAGCALKWRNQGNNATEEVAKLA